MKNSGKFAEQWFETHWKSCGKRVMLYQFEDFYQTTYKNKNTGRVSKPQPADYLLTECGALQFAEVKSSHNKTSFPFSDVQTLQWQMARKQQIAQGKYEFFILNMNHFIWFRVPARVLLNQKDAGFKSVKWSDLALYTWLPVVDKPTTFN